MMYREVIKVRDGESSVVSNRSPVGKIVVITRGSPGELQALGVGGAQWIEFEGANVVHTIGGRRNEFFWRDPSHLFFVGSIDLVKAVIRAAHEVGVVAVYTNPGPIVVWIGIGVVHEKVMAEFMDVHRRVATGRNPGATGKASYRGQSGPATTPGVGHHVHPAIILAKVNAVVLGGLVGRQRPIVILAPIRAGPANGVRAKYVTGV